MRILIIFSALITSMFIIAFQGGTGLEPQSSGDPFISIKGARWVDSVFNSLTPDQRIAQTFMIRAHSNKDEKYYRELEQQIRDFNIGGLCFFQGGPVRQALLSRRFQNAAQTPLLISIDGEWGLSMRLDSTPYFPRQMTLGAIKNDTLVELMGALIGEQCRRIGIHINFAPVADVNSNPKNPVINSRSFGESADNVARKCIAYMKGMQSRRVIACAKHFPGHGDTDTDSHYTLPIINHPFAVIDSPHLYPFRRLFEEGIGSVMVGHLFIPALDSTPNLATTLSPPVIKGLLSHTMGYKGLIITDALEMKGVAAYHAAGELEVKALKAGNDILLLPKSVDEALKAIRKAIDAGELSQEEIDNRCRKILAYKFWAGLSEKQDIDIRNIYSDLNNKAAITLNQKLYDAAATLVKNKDKLIPVFQDSLQTIATLTIGSNTEGIFETTLKQKLSSQAYFLAKNFNQEQANSMLKKLSQYDMVIISIRNTNNQAQQNYGITSQTLKLVEQISEKHKTLLALFANPYSLELFGSMAKTEGILLGYQDNAYAHKSLAMLISGQMECTGRLPVTASAYFPENTGIDLLRDELSFKKNTYEHLGEAIRLIDSIALDGIDKGAYPGCQITVMFRGKALIDKCYGTLSWNEAQAVTSENIYDLASLTKILATTLAVMKLYEQGKIDIDQTLAYYLPELKGSDKGNFIIRELLAHQARFKSWIPFYKQTLVNGQPDTNYYSKEETDRFTLQLGEKLYCINSIRDTILKIITNEPLNKTKNYLYSDLGYYYLIEIIEKQTKTTLDQYVYENFYRPMGLKNTFYNPLKYVDKRLIAPTENDLVFRKQLIQGYVHDQGAAMMGGVGGHAGLFSNANEVAQIMQMLLDKGSFQGKQYLKESTVAEFTKRQFPLNKNRRGLGFDKPLSGNQEGGPCCKYASDRSFGHSGFTGTFAWADPDYNLVYVFLSNRIHPDAENKKLLQMEIRTKIHAVIYEEMIRYGKAGKFFSL